MTYRNLTFSLICFSLVLFASACNFDHFPPRFEYYPPANQNIENLQHLKVGMTQDEVRHVMGESHQGKGLFARTPYVWWYYTQTVWRDGSVTQEECTPVCFDSSTGLLMGWGYDFYNKNVQFGNWKSNFKDEIE